MQKELFSVETLKLEFFNKVIYYLWFSFGLFYTKICVCFGIALRA